MKGIVFTEFLEMVEEEFGLEVMDNIIESSNLPSNGIYTSIGTYSFAEMQTLVTQLSKQVNIPVNNLLYAFGKFLFNSLKKAHPEVIKMYTDPLNLVNSIEDHIHVHVKKLYPDAKLPFFKVMHKSDETITLVYESGRGLYKLAQGLLEQAFIEFGKTPTIQYELLNQDGTEVKFDIAQNG